MSYFSEWNKKTDAAMKSQDQSFITQYYTLEKEAYDTIMSEYPDKKVWKGTFAELQEALGFGKEPVIFAGFLEGVNPTIKKEMDLESLVDESELEIEIDFEKLLYNMYDAKANWLYDLASWDNVMPVEKRKEIKKTFNTDHTAVSNKVGRNDPCICGSAKKYKNCCA